MVCYNYTQLHTIFMKKHAKTSMLIIIASRGAMCWLALGYCGTRAAVNRHLGSCRVKKNRSLPKIMLTCHTLPGYPMGMVALQAPACMFGHA